MGYSYQYINYLYQYGLAQYTLLIVDQNGVIPNYRVDKVFEISEEDVTDQYLSDKAVEEIQVMINLYNESLNG